MDLTLTPIYVKGDQQLSSAICGSDDSIPGLDEELLVDHLCVVHVDGRAAEAVLRAVALALLEGLRVFLDFDPFA